MDAPRRERRIAVTLFPILPVCGYFAKGWNLFRFKELAAPDTLARFIERRLSLALRIVTLFESLAVLIESDLPAARLQLTWIHDPLVRLVGVCPRTLQPAGIALPLAAPCEARRARSGPPNFDQPQSSFQIALAFA